MSTVNDMYGDYTPAVIFMWREIENEISKLGIEKVRDNIEGFWKRAADTASWKWANQHLYFDYNSCLFKFMIDSSRAITIWTNFMGREMFVYNTAPLKEKEGKELVRELNKLDEAMGAFIRGKIRCSSCGDLFDVTEVMKNSYWAGHYCSKCWSNKYKELESKEKYN